MPYIYCIMILRISYLSLTVGVLITTHPQYELVDISDSVNFTCEASGSLPIYYRWLYNGNYIMDDPGHIDGINTTILMIVNVTVTDWGVYSCEASNSFDNATSDGATLHGVCVCVCVYVCLSVCPAAVCASVSLYVCMCLYLCVHFLCVIIMRCSVRVVPCNKNVGNIFFCKHAIPIWHLLLHSYHAQYV